MGPEKGLQSYGLLLKQQIELQYFGHLMQRTDSFEKTLMLGKLRVGGEGEDRGGEGEDRG